MIKVGNEKFNPPLAKIQFLAKMGVKNLKSAQNSTKSDWAQIFRVVQAQQMIKGGDEKFTPLHQKTIVGQKGGQKA